MSDYELAVKAILCEDIIAKLFWFTILAGRIIERDERSEAEPIKHGRWKVLASGNDAICTNCEKYWIPAEDKYDFWYCPHCGAKMDEVEE